VLLHEIISSLKKRYRKNFIDKHFLTKIENNDKFIYFPLAVDEERTLLVDAPFFTNQLEILRNIVKSMPIDYKLYVKETPSQRARKWRKISEYQEMLEIPNVRMIHPSVPPAELYKKCSLAITIIGSAGLEAAFYEKPAIVFSDINYAILPSVSRIKSFEDLSKAIHNSLNKKVMASDLDKYITLVKKNSFLADIFELRTKWHDRFFYGGYLIDVDIPIPKMKNFLEENKSTFEKLADENFKKIKEYKKITNLDISN
jgi:capsule polysaccharide modification protein KpsS